MEPGSRAGRPALRGVSQTGVNQRAERLGSRDGAAQLLRRAASARAGGRQMTPERWLEVERLYHSALEQEPGERAEFLAQACQGDAELRRETEELLAQRSLSANILE